jgi:hypothetical protein
VVVGTPVCVAVGVKVDEVGALVEDVGVAVVDVGVVVACVVVGALVVGDVGVAVVVVGAVVACVVVGAIVVGDVGVAVVVVGAMVGAVCTMVGANVVDVGVAVVVVGLMDGRDVCANVGVAVNAGFPVGTDAAEGRVERTTVGAIVSVVGAAVAVGSDDDDGEADAMVCLKDRAEKSSKPNKSLPPSETKTNRTVSNPSWSKIPAKITPPSACDPCPPGGPPGGVATGTSYCLTFPPFKLVSMTIVP